MHAATDAEAASRFEEWAQQDPLPEIPSALLNSADIRDYVKVTGMVFPFHDDDDHLKPASYEVPLLGRYVYWDENNLKVDGEIGTGDAFILEPNSIAFVTLEPTFRLPDYIALRFNLKITHIYRGLLLGTGPLVDPGFVGRLSLPLHNLTTNSYTFYGGEGLIWMEFTKLSPLPNVSRRAANVRLDRSAAVFLDPKKSSGMRVDDYLKKADRHRSIRSSIPDLVGEAQRSAREARDEAEKLVNRIQRFGVVALLGAALALAAVVIAVFTLIHDVNARLDSRPGSGVLQEQILDMRTRLAELEGSTTSTVSTIGQSGTPASQP